MSSRPTKAALIIEVVTIAFAIVCAAWWSSPEPHVLGFQATGSLPTTAVPASVQAWPPAPSSTLTSNVQTRLGVQPSVHLKSQGSALQADSNPMAATSPVLIACVAFPLAILTAALAWARRNQGPPSDLRVAIFSTTGEKNNEEQKDDSDEESAQSRALPIKPGTGLSLSTRLRLDTMDDLTPEMKQAARAAAERIARNLRNAEAIEELKKEKTKKSKYRVIELSWDEMEEREREKEDSMGSFTVAQSTGMVNAQEYQRNFESYQALKRELSLLTAGFATACAVTAFLLYGLDTGISAGLGGVGGIIYQRLLARKAEDDRSAPTLLIPAALFALTVTWKKYNGPERFGFELELLPVIVGFLTYRLSGVVVGIRDIIQADAENRALMEQKAKEEAEETAAAAAETSNGGTETTPPPSERPKPPQ